MSSTLELAAALGAASSAPHEGSAGKGVKYATKDARIVQNHYAKMYDMSFFEDKMRSDLIETLLTALAASLLTSLRGGKGLYRAGGKSQGRVFFTNWVVSKKLNGASLTKHYINDYCGKSVCYPRNYVQESIKQRVV